MKVLKSTALLIVLLCFTVHFSQAQQRYQIHEDNVRPSMVGEYEKTSKEFLDACKQYNPKTSWSLATSSDFKYSWISPMENFAELDERPFTEMAKAMGDDWKNIFSNFDKCYDSHRDYILTLSESLTFMPEGSEAAQEGQNHRHWYYLYYTPENAAKLYDAMKGVKDMFVNKNSKLYYRIYRSGFGSPESYYLVAISSNDEIDAATSGKANEAVLGDERKAVFGNMMHYISRFEELTGDMRPDLAYSNK